jgi:hypothetical protein
MLYLVLDKLSLGMLCLHISLVDMLCLDKLSLDMLC